MKRTFMRVFPNPRHIIAALAASLCLMSDPALPVDLGGISLGNWPSKPLTIHMSMAPHFFRMVGGVAFSQVATGHEGLTIAALTYDSRQPDGSRLQITLNSHDGTRHQVWASIFDWELLPIANFADSEHHSVVTLYGSLVDEEDDLIVKLTGNKIINFHPAFQNTLLGLRLLQTDLLVIDRNAANLFTEFGTYIMGAGETPFNKTILKQQEERWAIVENWMGEQALRGNVSQSYVVSDIDQRVSFSFTGDRLVLRGTPIWYCWRESEVTESTAAKMRAEFDKRIATVSPDAAIVLLLDRFDYDYYIFQNELKDELRAQLTASEEKVRVAVRQKLDQKMHDKRAQLIMTFLTQTKHSMLSNNTRSYPRLVYQDRFLKELKEGSTTFNEQLFEDIRTAVDNLGENNPIRLEVKLFNKSIREDLPIDPMKKYSYELTSHINKAGGINGYVYGAALKTMRYSAFFRRFKQDHPTAYEAFRESISAINIKPAQPKGYDVKTPSVYPSYLSLPQRWFYGD